MGKSATLEQKQRGIFYTPNEATRILCSWAIRSPNDLLLEPSFGACGFLQASCNRLKELGCATPYHQLFGCDIDENAFEVHLWPLFDESNDVLKQFHIEDFLSITPGRFDASFDAVIGNPPYISRHRMGVEQKEIIQNAFADSPLRLDRRADLWAYFVLHSLQFLRVGGRMAWILPGSFLHSDYAALVRRTIGEQFARSLAIQLGQKLFVDEGAQENTIVLLADGYALGTQSLHIHYSPTLEDLSSVLTQWEQGHPVGQPCGVRVQEALLSLEVRSCLEDLESEFKIINLGSLCDIRIGIVTGANTFFIMSQSQAESRNLPPELLRPIVTKFEMVPGLRLDQNDLHMQVERNFACLLIDTNGLDERATGPVQDYLATFNAEEKQKNRTFNKRPIWHYSDDGRTPHAFLSYMHQHGPRLAINDAQTTSTNTVHRVYFKDNVGPIDQKATAVALQSTFGQLCAEIEGRAYGSGVLKHEPTGAGRIRLIMPSVITPESTLQAFESVNQCIRQGNTTEAQLVADRWAMNDVIVQKGEETFEQTRSILGSALHEMRTKRHHPPVVRN